MPTKRPSVVATTEGLLKAADVAKQFHERTGERISTRQVVKLARAGCLPIAHRDRSGQYFSERAIAALVARGTTRSDTE